jgi:hypothetical protein
VVHITEKQGNACIRPILKEKAVLINKHIYDVTPNLTTETFTASGSTIGRNGMENLRRKTFFRSFL